MSKVEFCNIPLRTFVIFPFIPYYYEDHCSREFERKYVGTTSSRVFIVEESYRREPTDFSRAIFPRSRAHPAHARVSLFARVDRPRRMQERDKDKRDPVRPTGLTDDPP